eukprot:COSAG03_NODE_1424_length_4103_cov_1.379371_2_plen_37_part_00
MRGYIIMNEWLLSVVLNLLEHNPVPFSHAEVAQRRV